MTVLQAAFEDQRRFVQDASHELRNPLATARASLELALTDVDPDVESLKQAASVAHRSTERMADLVDDLLVQARTGVPEITLGEVSVADLVSDVVDQFQAAAQQRSVDLVFDTVETADRSGVSPLVVTGDESGLYRAVSNLVSNAIRHAPPGTAVDVSLVAAANAVEVSVTDRGPGLSEHDQALVFQRFWTGSESNEGTGLGLSIVQQIAQRHGGSVRVHSVFGQGARFVLQLPTRHLNERRNDQAGSKLALDGDRLGSAATDVDIVVDG